MGIDSCITLWDLHWNRDVDDNSVLPGVLRMWIEENMMKVTDDRLQELKIENEDQMEGMIGEIFVTNW